MKTIILILLITTCGIKGYCQTVKPVTKTTTQTRTIQHPGTVSRPATSVTPANSTSPAAPAQMRETATDRYINGTSATHPSHPSSTNTNSTSSPSSPFAAGVHVADNAAQTFDTLHTNRSIQNRNIGSTTIAGGNDTTFNANTVNENGATTNSGAVDKSGQTQFGQTNWGDSRSTVGESQWTVPPPITASFSKEFPAASNASWSRNNVDTALFSARYKSGATWVTTNYNANGQRVDMRTEVPMVQPPRPVSVYLAKQPDTFHPVTINKVQVQGKADVYEILTQTGKTIYINTDGVEVPY